MAIAAGLRRKFESRLAAWVKRRQGGDSLPVAIHRRRLYILPTRAGLGFALLLSGMLLAGLNYANSLALFVTFLLGGLALAAMYMCHTNLLGAVIVGARTAPTFPGEDGQLELVIATGTTARFEYCLALRSPQGVLASPPGHAGAAERMVLRLPVPGARRGVYAVDRVRLSTNWPFGLFRAWTWLHLPLELIVYPAAHGERPLLRVVGVGQQATGGWPEAGDTEWQGLRAYRHGDSPRRIAWKAYARGAPLLVGDYTAEAGDLHEFDFDRLAPLDCEARLEQLSRWIVDAEQRGEPYALRLPGEFVAAGRGDAHRHRCLASLARQPA